MRVSGKSRRRRLLLSDMRNDLTKYLETLILSSAIEPLLPGDVTLVAIWYMRNQLPVHCAPTLRRITAHRRYAASLRTDATLDLILWKQGGETSQFTKDSAYVSITTAIHSIATPLWVES